MDTGHAILVVGAVGNLILAAFLWLQLREMRRESQRFWTSVGATLVRIWRGEKGED